MPNIINEDQTGFIKGRYIGENIVKLLNIMEYVEEEHIPSLLVVIDFEKAFDCLRWDFVQKAVESFNFGPSLINCVKLFYTDINSRVINNGWSSESFKPQRGVRQGCPLVAISLLYVPKSWPNLSAKISIYKA